MIDRSKFKATSIAKIQDQETEQKAKQPFGNDFSGFLKLEEGDNIIRIYPAHPDGESFTVFQSQVFLPVIKTSKDDNGVETQELKRHPVLNAIYHSNIMQKDVINEYIAFAKDHVKPTINSTEWGRIWGLITGRDDSLKSSDSWVVYADLYKAGGTKEFGKIGLKKSIKNDMNKISAEMAKDRGIDPFTDPDTGIRIVVNKDEARGKAGGNWYETTLESRMVDQFTKSFVPTPLSDEELEYFVSQDSLEKLYVNTYSQEDFMQAIEGLERWDKTNNIGIWNYQEFRNVLNELADVANTLPIRTEKPQEEGTQQAQVAPVQQQTVQAAPFTPDVQQPQVMQQPTTQPIQQQAPVQQVVQPVVEEGVKKDMAWLHDEPQAQQQPMVADGAGGEYPAAFDAKPEAVVQAEQAAPVDRLAAMKSKLAQKG